MRFTDFFIRRATTTTLLISAIAGFGVLSYFSLPVSNLPEVEFPTIRVNAILLDTHIVLWLDSGSASVNALVPASR